RSTRTSVVVSARRARWAAAGNRVVLGSDGIGAAMVDEFALAYVAQRADDVAATPDDAWGWLAAGAALVPEAGGDEVVWGAVRADPWYLAFTPGVRAERVVVGGEVVVDGGRCTRVDGERLRGRGCAEVRRVRAI